MLFVRLARANPAANLDLADRVLVLAPGGSVAYFDLNSMHAPEGDLAFVIDDCSDSIVLCIRSGKKVFAIPASRDVFDVGRTWKAAGLIFCVTGVYPSARSARVKEEIAAILVSDEGTCSDESVAFAKLQFGSKSGFVAAEFSSRDERKRYQLLLNSKKGIFHK